MPRGEWLEQVIKESRNQSTNCTQFERLIDTHCMRNWKQWWRGSPQRSKISRMQIYIKTPHHDRFEVSDVYQLRLTYSAEMYRWDKSFAYYLDRHTFKQLHSTWLSACDQTHKIHPRLFGINNVLYRICIGHCSVKCHSRTSYAGDDHERLVRHMVEDMLVCYNEPIRGNLCWQRTQLPWVITDFIYAWKLKHNNMEATSN